MTVLLCPFFAVCVFACIFVQSHYSLLVLQYYVDETVAFAVGMSVINVFYMKLHH